ncbi:MAG: flagellar biosynthetic protein FliR [Deltaproteobacteria bacterium]|nr:flagellar biosynthetic protein FliR [Deltaproteobacteria bacterium]
MSSVGAALEPARLVAFMLVLARAVGLVANAPIFGARMVPVRVRAACAFVLAVAMLPIASRAPLPAPELDSALGLTLAIAVEASVGFLLGLIVQLVFGAVQMAGELSGIQMGLGLASLIDPQYEDRLAVLGQWQNLFALLLFLAVDGHHMLIEALAESFRRVPAGTAGLTAESLQMTLAFAAGMFVLALKVAAPVLILLLLVNGGLGALAKLIPQLNVMVVGFPINVAAGFFILAAAEPFTLRLLTGAFSDVSRALGLVIESLA